ncbi:MAG: type VI secretion system tip protein VgrG [Nitrospirota bacterium]|nr:type VI secretion system tip protein VgrG [Nitrospirota bacterium]
MATFDDRLGRDKRFSFVSTAVSPNTFAVVELEGVEAISRPYEFTLTLVSERAELDLNALLARPVSLTIRSRTPARQPNPYRGVLVECSQLQQVADGLTFRRNSEVYLNQTVPQVIETVLKNSGFGSADYEFRLARKDYRVLPYICQFEESALTFISRWMEWRGLYYFFEQGADQEKMIVTDNRLAHVASRDAVTYRPAAQLDTGVADEFVQALICTQKQVPRKVGVKEYHYDKATLSLIGEAEVSAQGTGEMWLYGEHFWTAEGSAKLASIRAEELACREKVFHGEATATGLRAGYTMGLQGHYRADCNREYLAMDVRHEGSQAGSLLAGLSLPSETGLSAREDFYRATFSAIPSDVQFRSERLTPKPRISGVISAFVDAEGSGDYAEIDEQGRYKVQVPFDKTDKAAGKGSAWVRKASQYSGKDHGLHYPLHKGAEVLLGFENGDPDRPIILGSVFNSQNPNMVTRNNQTQTVLHTAGGNHMQFEDQEGEEHIFFSTPKAGTSLRLGAGPQSTVGAQAAAGTSFSDRDGFVFSTNANWSETTSGNKTATVSGNLSVTTSGAKTEEVDGDQTETVKGKRIANWGTPGLAGSEAGQFIPVASTVGPHVGNASAHFTPTSQEMIWGGHSQTVMGNMSRTAIGTSHSDTFISAGSTTFHIGAHLNVGVVEVQSWGQYVNAAVSKIQAAVNKVATAVSKVTSSVNRVQVAEDSVEVDEIRSQLAALRLANMEVDVEDQGVAVQNSGVHVHESETRVSNSSGIAIQNAPIIVNDAGVAFLG